TQLIVSGPRDGAKDADRLRKVWLFHAREHERHRRILKSDIVNQNVCFGDSALADGHDFRMRAIHANAFISIFAIDHWLAVLKVEHPIRAYAALGEVIECAIIKYIAVLIDL